MKARKDAEKDLYQEKLTLMRQVKTHETNVKQHDAEMKILKETQTSAQAEEDAKIAKRMAAGQRVSTRDRVDAQHTKKKSAASQAVKEYTGPTSKEQVDTHLALKRENNRERIQPLGIDRMGNRYAREFCWMERVDSH